MAPDRRSRSFRALGSDAELVVVGGTDDDLSSAASFIAQCERRWSRFLPTSELSQLNRGAGRPVVLPRDTYDLIVAAVSCWELSAGRFDPTVLPALIAAGYDASFEVASFVPRPAEPAPGCGDIVLDDELSAVTLPPGMALDLGGIGKGHIADLASALLIERGAAGALVNLGGDVRVRGCPPDDDGWTVAIADPFDHERDLLVLRLSDGAVATSSTVRRRWSHGDHTMHHLIDPRTGRPASTSLATATVIAESAAWAEVTAKVAVIAGARDAAQIVHAAGATGLLVHDDRHLTLLDGLETYQ